MNLNTINAKLTAKAGKVIFETSKKSPEILIGVGVAGVVTSTVLACKATLKLNGRLTTMQDELSIANELKDAVGEEGRIVGVDKETGEDREVVYSETDYRKDLFAIYTKNVFVILKDYAPALIIGTLSLAAILGSHKILKGRNIALASAYKALDVAYEEYRSRVREEYGEEKDRDFHLGLRDEKKTVKELNEETGKEVSKKINVKTSNGTTHSPYARFFDEFSTQWQRNPQHNLFFLRAQQQMFNDLLISRGHVFLNEVYDALGFERTEAGNVVGWVLNKDGDNYIDFGIYDITSPGGRLFVNGQEPSILLDFNVDGYFLNTLNEKI